MRKLCMLIALPALLPGAATAQEIGSVNTEWKLMGSHQLVVEAYDDPKVEGVTCYVAKPERGGIAGAVGVAEEVSDVPSPAGKSDRCASRKPCPCRKTPSPNAAPSSLKRCTWYAWWIPTAMCWCISPTPTKSSKAA